ncbi:outer membrane lipoprotein-sorting protein [Dinoroseobacter sp. S76]|uniref:outer membrane lipoprotein-sorting protein n=1 Tax=Dinoroseobacter sp. S76 TaxID=3415124 RepID=UPI003C7E8CA6
MNRLMIVACATALALTPLTGGAQTAEEKGFAIAQKSDLSDKGFGRSSVDVTMTLTNRAGARTTRALQIDTLEKSGRGNGDRSMIQFFSPGDVDGTALLSHARVTAADDQWLYLPSLSRVKRISSANKSGPFVGSEFSFEDLTISELGKFEYRYLETRRVDGMEMSILECTPAYSRSGYSRVLCHFDTKTNQPRKFVFFDRGGQRLKTLTLTDYKRYGSVWRAQTQTMVNHLTGKTTVLEFGPFDFNARLGRNDFEPSALERL